MSQAEKLGAVLNTELITVAIIATIMVPIGTSAAIIKLSGAGVGTWTLHLDTSMATLVCLQDCNLVRIAIWGGTFDVGAVWVRNTYRTAFSCGCNLSFVFAADWIETKNVAAVWETKRFILNKAKKFGTVDSSIRGTAAFITPVIVSIGARIAAE